MKDAFLNFVAGLQFVQYVGGMAVVSGLYGIVRGKIPYGWRGLPPSGYITGPAVRLLGIFVFLVGMFCIFDPAESNNVLGWQQGPPSR